MKPSPPIDRDTRRPGALAALAAALLLLATAPAARAQGGLAAQWADCPPGGGPTVTPSCDSNVGERRLYMAFVPGVEVQDVVGWTLVLDLVSNVATLPDWWQVQSGGCRAGEITAAPPTGLEASCVDVWSATGAALLQSYLYPRPGGDAAQLRLVLGVGVPAGNAFTLSAGENYMAGVVSIHFAKTVLPGGCEGCTEPACFVFNSAEIVRLPGASGEPPQPFVTPLNGTGNQATWGAATACSTVPARARTWGQIKSLYR